MFTSDLNNPYTSHSVLTAGNEVAADSPSNHPLQEDGLTELRAIWVSQILNRQERLDERYTERHPLQAAVQSLFFAR